MRLYDVFSQDEDTLKENQTADMRAFFAGTDRDSTVPNPSKTTSTEIKTLLAKLLQFGERSLTQSELIKVREYKRSTSLHRRQFKFEEGVAEGHGSEELANEVYAEFERTYPNLARRADERTVHAAIMDVLNYGGDSNPSALAQDVARAVKQEMQQGVAEAAAPVTHRIGLTVTDPNHPMVSKRDETYQKSVRVTGPDREAAINQAIAHYRRKGYKVHDHHYLGTVDEPMAEATGDKPFDQMMTTIKRGTNKQKTADRKEQQKQTQQQARNAFGNMFGGGNPADKLKIREQGVAEASNTMQRYGQTILKRAKAARAAEQAARAAELEPKKEEPPASSDYSSMSTRDYRTMMQQLKKPKKKGVAEDSLNEDPVIQFASKAHNEWRKNFDPTGTKERIKKNSDGTEGNINVPFEELHPDWKKENLAAGQAAMMAVKRFPNNIEQAAEYIHNEWMKRNPKADYNAAQHVAYDQLPEDEKEKDRVHVRTMMALSGKQGVAEELDQEVSWERRQAFINKMNPLNKKYHTNNPHMTGTNDIVSVNTSGARATKVMPMTAPKLVTKKPSTTVARATPGFNNWISKYKENMAEGHDDEDPFELSSDYALHIANAGRKMMTQLANMSKKIQTDSTAAQNANRWNLGDFMHQHYETDDLNAINQVFEEYGVGGFFDQNLSELLSNWLSQGPEYVTAWKQYSGDVIKNSTRQPSAQSVHEQGVAEAKDLKKSVKIVKGPDAGKTGWIREIKHGAFKGAPKTYYIDLDGGGQANNLPATALRLVKDQGMAESNVFTDARMNAIKAGKDTFAVHGKTYQVTGDTSDEREAGLTENNHWHDAGVADARRDVNRNPNRKVKTLNPRTRLKTMQDKQARHPEEVEQYSIGYRGVKQGVAEGLSDPTRKVFFKVIKTQGTGMPSGYRRVKTMRPLEDGGFYIELSTPGYGMDYTRHNYKNFSLKDDQGKPITGHEANNIINGEQGVAEGSLNEFAQGNGGDDGEAFNPGLAKMAQEHGFTKGFELADGASLATAFKITEWDQQFGGLYKQHFVQGFKKGRMDKINFNNKQHNLNLKLMKDGSIIRGEQGVAEGSEWETRHNEFVTVGDRATPEQINKIVKALVGAAQQAGSKRGFLNQLVGKQSNGDLARMAHSAETLAKNIQQNSNAKPGTDERKELGQQLVYAVSLLKRISGEQGVAEGSQLNELAGYASDNKYKHLGSHKRYDVYVSKQKFNNLFFIAIAENPRTLEAKFKTKGNNPEEAVNNLKLEIDKEIDVATKVSGHAILDFNVDFVKDILELSTDVFYAKIVAGPKLVIAGRDMMEYPEIMRDDGFKSSAIRTYKGGEGTTKLPGVPLSAKSAAASSLIANGRYVLGDETSDKDGNRVFDLKFDSVVHASNEKIRLRAPALTVGTNRSQGVTEAPTSVAVRLGRAIERTQGKTAASQARSIIPSSIPKKEEPKKDEKKVDEGIQAGDGFIIECGDSAIETVVLGHYNDGILIEFDHTATFMLTDAGITLTEAEYQGRTVPLGKRMAGDVKKSKVYVKKPNGNVVKVNFGDKNMTIKKHLPKHRKSYRARHHCENPGPKWKANYWSCRAW